MVGGEVMKHLLDLVSSLPERDHHAHKAPAHQLSARNPHMAGHTYLLLPLNTNRTLSRYDIAIVLGKECLVTVAMFL